MSVNKAILIGRLGKDVDLQYTPGGKAVAKFSIATSETWKDAQGEKQEKTTWHNIVAWGKLAEICAQYLAKGMQVYIEGRIDNRSYEKDGQTRYISEIIMSTMQMLGQKPNSSDSGQNKAQDEHGAPPEFDDIPF